MTLSVFRMNTYAKPGGAPTAGISCLSLPQPLPFQVSYESSSAATNLRLTTKLSIDPPPTPDMMRPLNTRPNVQSTY